MWFFWYGADVNETETWKKCIENIKSALLNTKSHSQKRINVTQTDFKKNKAPDKLIANKIEAVLSFHNYKVTLANDFKGYFNNRVSIIWTKP